MENGRLDEAKLAELRRVLEARRVDLRGEVSRMAAEVQDLGVDQGMEGGTVGNHLADDGSNVMEVERLGTISGDLQEILAQVDSALERMDEGTYGSCLRCGKPIGEERLEAFPYVAFDIECQQIVERENALRSGG